MKIRIDKDIAEFIPENAAEAVELEALWIKMGNCVGATKRLEPMGVYMRATDKSASFHIEGLTDEEAKAIPQVLAHTTLMCTATSAIAQSMSRPVSPFHSAAADLWKC